MSLNFSFVIYNHENLFHWFNIFKFVKKLKFINYYWIIMIYYFAIKQKIYDSFLTYVDDLSQ